MAFSIPIEVVYNAFYFAFYAGYAPFIMFRPVYFKYIGLSPVFVGLLCGCRFILQSAGTPVLVMIAERLGSRKLMFVISYLILIGKLLIILILLRPQHQLCVVKHIGHQTTQNSYVIHHDLSKRNLLQADSWNETEEDAAILWEIPDDERKTSFNTTDRPLSLSQKNNSPTSLSFKDPFKISTKNITKISNNASGNISEKNSGTKLFRSTLQPTVDPRMAVHIVYNDKEELFRIFVSLLLLILLSDAFDSTMFTLVDESCFASVDADHYGQAQTCGAIGWGIMVPNIGLIMYFFNQEICGKYIGSFHYVFYFTFGFLTIAFLCGLCLEFTTSRSNVLVRKVPGPSSSFQYSMFTFASAYSGFCNGFLLSFTYWFIDSLGGNAVIMGLATGCRSVCNIIIGVFIMKLIERIGHQIVVDVGLVCHIVVFVGYYEIKKPLFVLLGEIFFATFHIAVTRACSSYLQMKAPTGSNPKMQGISQQILWGLGTGAGALLGGYYLEYSGFTKSFLGFSIITSIVAIVFLFLQVLLYLINPEDTLDEMWTVWSANTSRYASEYGGSASDEDSDGF